MHGPRMHTQQTRGSRETQYPVQIGALALNRSLANVNSGNAHHNEN